MPVRGRMLSASLSQSRKFSRLENNDHRLMFVMLIPHVDAEGRHDAEPAILAGKCYTTLGFGHDDIAVGLGDMSNVGLITLYESEGDMFLEVVDFHTYQTIRRKGNGEPVREAPSKIPPPSRRNGAPPTDNCRTTDAVVTEDSGSSATLSAAQSKAKQSKGETPTGPLPPEETPENHGGTTEGTPPATQQRAGPKGPRPSAVDDYLRRQAPREKTHTELEAERLIRKAVEA